MNKTLKALWRIAVAAVMSAAVPGINAQLPQKVDDVIKACDFEKYLHQAEEGDSESMRRLSFCYQYGNGCERDMKKSLKWLARSADDGNLEAQYDVAMMYLDGIGYSQSYEEAAYWFRKAASNGHALSQFNIGRLFEQGRGVLQDYRVALENYWRAAEQDVPAAQYALATMLRDGRGTAVKPARALYWFERAAAHSYKDSAEQAELLRKSGAAKKSAQSGTKKRTAKKTK